MLVAEVHQRVYPSLHIFLLLTHISVLQGYMYLTDSYLCFFAHLPAKEVRCCPHRNDVAN